MDTRTRPRHRAGRALGVALAALVALTPGLAHAVTIPVTTTGDAIDPGDGLCSLREAIIAANTDTASGAVPGECAAGSGVNTISLPAGMYTLTIGPSGANDATSGDLNITKALTIAGTGHPTVRGAPGGPTASSTSPQAPRSR